MVSFRRRYEPGFPRWTDFRPRGGVHRADRPVGQLVRPCRQLDGRPSDEACGLCDPGASRLVTLTVPFSDTAAASPPLAITPAPCTVLQITSGATLSRSIRPRERKGHKGPFSEVPAPPSRTGTGRRMAPAPRIQRRFLAGAHAITALSQS